MSERSFSSLFYVLSVSVCHFAASARCAQLTNEPHCLPPAKGVAFAPRALPPPRHVPQRAARRRLVRAYGASAPRARARPGRVASPYTARRSAPPAEESPPHSPRDGRTSRRRRYGRSCTRTAGDETSSHGEGNRGETPRLEGRRSTVFDEHS